MQITLWVQVYTLLALLSLSAFGQQVSYNEEAEALFRRAVDKYDANYYLDAIAMFENLLGVLPFHQRTTAASVMKGKALFKSGDLVEADRTLKLFLASFPASSYVPDAEYSLGLINLKIQRPREAARLFQSSWEKSHGLKISISYEEHFLMAFEKTIDKFLSLEDLEGLENRCTTDDCRAFLTLKKADFYLARGNISGAARMIDSLRGEYPHHRFGDREFRIASLLQDRSHVALGVLVPLLRNHPPSVLKEIGTEIHEGILFALEEYLHSPLTRVKVSLEIRDTERDPFVATRHARDLISNQDVIGIIGPVFSNVAVATAGIVNVYDVPLVTPTANTNGLAEKGRFIFQANPDYENRGRASAQYAIRSLGLKTFAVVAPEDGVGRQMADGFLSELIALGGNAIATEWYSRGNLDLKSQLSNIRRTGMMAAADPVISFEGQVNQGDVAKLIQLGVPLKRLDSLMKYNASVSGTALLGPDARKVIDSLEITATYHDPRIDSLIYPVTSIDAVYAPINSANEISVISSQLAFFNFQTQILGSGEWFNFQELDANKRYCRNVVFETDYYANEETQLFAQFRSQFTKRFNKSPGKNTLYGYDTAKLMLALIHSGATSRETMQKALASVDSYPGLHSRIGLARRRVNSWLHMMQYDGKQIVRLTDVNVDSIIADENVDEPGEP